MIGDHSTPDDRPPKPKFDPNKEVCDWTDGKWVVNYKWLVPDKVSMWAFKEAVAASGQIIELGNAIEKLPEPDRAIAINRWVARKTMERSSEITRILKRATGWTQKQLNDIFVDAMVIEKNNPES